MAQTIAVVLVDDLDGGPAVETVRFEVDGAGFEIDLSAAHAAELRRVLAPFVAAARPVGHARPAARPRPHGRSRVVAAGGTADRGTTEDDTEVLTEMREWARANGFSVGGRGRISREAREAFLATPPQVRAEQAATFAELAELAGTEPGGTGGGSAAVVPRPEFRAAPSSRR